jgi:hypothetical protein
MPTTIERLIERRKSARRTIAKLVLEQHRLRNEMLELAKQIGSAQNAVDLGTEVSAMAARDVEKLTAEFTAKLKTFEHNEFEKINARLDALKLEIEIQKS